MTTPYENEYGSWFPEEDKWFVPSFYDTYVSGTKDTIESVHKEDLAEVAKYKGVDKDRAYQRLAIRNIKETPLKYLQNIVYNFGRLVFQYPFSYGVHRPKLLLVFPANGILLGLILFCLIPTFLNWRKILYPIKFLIFITLIYLGGSTLVTAYVRMFTIIVPILIFWMAYICQHCVTINLKFSLKASNAK
jgi:predicted RND superfamily exporter protein